MRRLIDRMPVPYEDPDSSPTLAERLAHACAARGQKFARFYSLPCFGKRRGKHVRRVVRVTPLGRMSEFPYHILLTRNRRPVVKVPR
ncbi:MAG: hypothetical protein ACHQQR_11390 [Gemmatimonadales bacterium]